MIISPTAAFAVALVFMLAALSPRMAFFVASVVAVFVGLFALQAQLGYF